MSANSAKFFFEIDGFQASEFTVTRFTGSDGVSAPYNFEIDFQPSESSQTRQAAVTADQVLGRSCRFTVIRGDKGEETVYSGVVKEFRAKRHSKPVYTIRLIPWLGLLSMNVNNRVFQNLTALDIVKKVIAETGIEDHCELRYDCETTYPEIAFCVQYNETDLNFISRLMEGSGIWYYFENMGGGLKKDRVTVTDRFSGFPEYKIDLPYNESGADTGNFGESIHSLETKAALIPKSVRLRTQNYRTPESLPEGRREPGAGCPGEWGGVNEYGGAFKNLNEAERLAALYIKRLKVENMCAKGQSTCNAFRAGRFFTINNAGGGRFLLTSVTHEGGADRKGDYTYKNTFICIDSAAKIYAPPLRAIPPRVDGLITAPVDATGADHPSLDEMGRYKVRLPYDESGAAAYCATKNIRLVQPSGGYSENRNYGTHFPSKQGAEMVIAYVDGNPDKPVGLGFVPNSSALSVVTNKNRDLNVIRTWGDNVLIMDDTPDRQKIAIATSGNGHLYNNEYGIAPDAKTPNNELLFDNERKLARVRAFLHKIVMSYNDEENSITIMTEANNSIKLDDKGENITIRTAKGNIIEMNDPDNLITVQNSNDNDDKNINKAVFNGKDKNITIDSAENTVVINGKEKRITLESEDSKIAIDGKGKKISMENKDNKVVIDGSAGTIKMNAKSDVTITSGGQIVLDAKNGVSNKGAKIYLKK